MPWEELDGMDDMTTKPSPKEIMRRAMAAGLDERKATVYIVSDQVKALTDAGYAIVKQSSIPPEYLLDNQGLPKAFGYLPAKDTGS